MFEKTYQLNTLFSVSTAAWTETRAFIFRGSSFSLIRFQKTDVQRERERERERERDHLTLLDD
jgi:hypothetical protein